jgi:hypothetical protein
MPVNPGFGAATFTPIKMGQIHALIIDHNIQRRIMFPPSWLIKQMKGGQI